MCTVNPWTLLAFSIINNLGLIYIYQLIQLTKMEDLIAKKQKTKKQIEL